MVNRKQDDVVIVGGGIAGMISANRAAQLGLKVTVLEKGTAQKYLCNTRITGGSFHICHRDIMHDEAILKQAILDSTAGFVPEEFAALIAKDGRRVVRWLQDEGLKFMRASGSEHHRWVLSPPGRSKPGIDWEGRAGDVLLRTLEQQLTQRGSAIVRGAHADALITDGARCTGVLATIAGQQKEFRARAVIITDGGFQGNPEMVGRYISKYPERIKQRGAGTGHGDGLRMAQAIGAATTSLDAFYGHVLSRDSLTNDLLWPYPMLDAIVTAGIIVNAHGERFVDEGRGGVFVANAIARLDDPLSAVCIFDRDIWEQPGARELVPPNPNLPEVGGTLFQAEDLAALAAQAGLPAAALCATVDTYNSAIKQGVTSSLPLTPERRTQRYQPMMIAKPPFYAIPAVAGITYTMGGIAININTQVVRADASIIDGLFAAGIAAGGLEGGPQIGYVAGLARCGVTALRAAEHIAEQLGST